MREEFRRELRGRLMQEAPVLLAARQQSGWSALFRSAMRPAFAVGLAGILLVASAGTAAAGSLPGDPAFVIKRTFEDVQVTLTLDEVQRVQLLAQLADRRLQELQEIANKNDGAQGNTDDKAIVASEEFAKAITKLKTAVDQVQVQQGPNADTSKKVQQVVDSARDKHEQQIGELEDKVTDDKAKATLERARDEERKDTHGEQQGNKDDGGDNGGDRTSPRPSRSPAPSRTPKASESPRATETPRRTARPSFSIRPSSSDRAPIQIPSFRPSPDRQGDRESD